MKARKLNKKAIATYVKAIRAGLTKELAAKSIGVARETVYRWYKRGEKGDNSSNGIYIEFYNAATKAEAEQAEHLLGIIEAAAPKDWRAAAWILERRHSYTKPAATIINETKVDEAAMKELAEVFTKAKKASEKKDK